MNHRLRKIKEAIAKRPYVFYFAGIFLSYIFINLLINNTFATIPNFFKTYKFSFAISFLALNLITAFFVGVVGNLSIIKFKEFRKLKRLNKKGSAAGGGVGVLGIIGGIIGGACPGCLVGFFPALLGLFGITASLSILPLHGLEVQIFSSAILMAAIFFLTKEHSCKIGESCRGKFK